jgi:tetratricopeptide (TPR) repeat protein
MIPLACLSMLLLAPPPLPTPPPSAVPQTPANVWRSPAFRQLMIESFLAESDVEPKLTPLETRQMQEILDLLGQEDEAGKAEAEASLRRNAARPDSAATFDFTLGQILFQRDDLEGASAAYAAAASKFPKFRRAWRSLGIIAMRRQEHAAAIPSLVRVVELGGGDAVTYGLLGFAYASTGDDLAAESCFRMAVLLDPETLDWRMQLARTLFNQKRYADAAALCGTLIERFPSRGDLWLLQANALLGLGQPMKAAENFEIVEAMGEATSDSLNLLGDIYVNEGLYDPAVDAYARAMAATPPSDPDRAIRAAAALVARAAYPATRRLIAAVEEASGDRLSAEDRKTLLKIDAKVAAAEGDGERAIPVLERIVELDPLDGDALVLLGLAQRRAGRVEEAAFAFERAGAIEAFEAEAKLRHGQMLVAETRYREALPLLRRSLALRDSENLRAFIEQVERAERSARGR